MEPPFGLGADINENLIAIDSHDRAINGIAILEVVVIVGGVKKELFHQRTIFDLLGRLTVWRTVGEVGGEIVLLVGRSSFCSSMRLP